MGQAKARGPREQRVAEGIAKNTEKDRARAKELAERRLREIREFEALPLDEQVRIKMARATLQSVIAMAGGIGIPLSHTSRRY